MLATFVTKALTMEKLSAVQQQQIKKMLNERLRVKLISTGYKEEMIMGLERDGLMSMYAEVIASGKLMARPAGYDPEVEKQRLAFEQMKWEEEHKRWEIEMEEENRN